ncbi:sensor histidine kinase [Sinosporangium siamense]|uniref:Uncharacterized protein n=1 Tax=Sinosporangium siamense TaxID=1367973 RepID=A0A919V972_9ACTN|nr:hypothetical protein [Sinosporangium siamense]GII94996.1 hypothetical protein Ssi02_52270 [Sinosporangium siamense]
MSFRLIHGEKPRGFAEELEDYFSLWSQRTGITVEVWATPQRALPNGVGEVVLTMIHEALDHVENHSGASTVSIALTANQRAAYLTISDDGDQEPAQKDMIADTVTMAGLSELGGTLTINSVPQAGTTLSVSLPYPAAPPCAS